MALMRHPSKRSPGWSRRRARPGAPRQPPDSRDPDDDKVIATAIVGQADYLVTEDGDLQTHTVRAVLAESGVSVASMRELTAQLDRLTE
jgi:predicted nucleic acid-binding protein